MGIFAQTNGQRVLRPQKLSSTSNFLICTATEKGTLTIESITIAAGAGATGALFSLSVTNGTTDWFLMNGSVLADHQTTILDTQHIPLQVGWSIKAQCNTAGVVDVIAVAFQSNPTQGPR